MTIPTEPDGIPTIIPNSNTSQNTKNSKARFSTPAFLNNQQGGYQGMNFGQQMNYNQNQQAMYNNMNNLYQQPHESLFGIPEQQYKQDNSLRDMSNIQHNKDMNSNFPFKNFNKAVPTPNTYQPTMYQNNNNFAQINMNKKPIEQEFGSNNNMFGNFKEAPNILSRNLPQDYSSSKPGTEGKAKGEENLQEINRKHEELINVILAEEEEVISLHRQHIDDMVDLIKQVNRYLL